VEEDLKEMKVRNWREKCKDRRLWNEIIEQAKTHQGLYNVREACPSGPVGKPKLRWIDQVEEDLKEMKVRNWREKCKDMTVE
jgi:hypothetical protein